MRFLNRNVATLATILVFCVICFVASKRYDNFLTVGNFTNLLRDNAFLGIAAVGMTFVILSGGIDLSVGAVIGFTSILVATLVEKKHLSPTVAIAMALAIGTAFGAAMGYIISAFEVPAFLVTLAGMFLARGLALVISQESIELTSSLHRNFGTKPLFLPILFLLVLIAGALILQFRPFGRTVYAIGGNETSARMMGLPVHKSKIAIYALSGFTAALAGVAHGFYTISGNATAGTTLELDCIASVVIGGTLLQGGVGNLIGTFFGVALLGLIQTMITFEGTLSSWWTKIVIGALMLIFLGLQKAVEIGISWRRRMTASG